MQTTSPNIRAIAGRPEQAHSDNTSSRSPLATALALAAMSLGLGVVQLDITIVNTALSSIGASLGGSVAELQWVVTAYTIAFAAFILTAGALGDRLGVGGRARVVDRDGEPVGPEPLGDRGAEPTRSAGDERDPHHASH